MEEKVLIEAKNLKNTSKSAQTASSMRWTA